MNSNANVVLRKKANREGKYPIAIRITKNRNSNYLYIGHYIDIKDWDEGQKRVKKTHANHQELNLLILNKLTEANRKLLYLQNENKDLTARQVKKNINASRTVVNFFDMADDFFKELTANHKFSRLSSDKARINNLKKFNKGRQLTFQELDENLLRKFIVYLRNVRKITERSIINHLVVIRTIYNRAIKQGLVDRRLYPFGSDKIRIKFPETQKVGLTTDEIEIISNLKGLNSFQKHALNVWLFSFYFAGIRVGDVLKIKWSDIVDGRLQYTMNKNQKVLSLKIPEKVYLILKQYESDKQSQDDFIFPELKKAEKTNPKDVFIKTKLANRALNVYLEEIAEKAKINKKLTMHISRHSFGNISGDRIPIQMLQKLYRHSSVTTTINYQANFMQKDVDEALEKVINF